MNLKQSLRCLFNIVFLSLTLLWPALAADNFNIIRNTDIRLLDNRFRIDPGVKEATFLLYRRDNAPAAVIVRPDGSKIHAWDVPSGVAWVETANMDIVTLSNPEPGPWQAIAKNDGTNRIRILSDVELAVAPFPRFLFQNERLKIEAVLSDSGSPVVLETMLPSAFMRLSLFSALEITDDNQGVEEIVIGEYLDDGKNYDAYAQDGIFTAHAVMDVLPGRFDFVVSTQNEVFSRAYRQAVFVYPSPVTITLEPPAAFGEKAKFSFVINDDELNPEGLYFAGKVFNNVGWEETFEIYPDEQRTSFDIPSLDKDGRYRVSVSLFGQTMSGREIVIDLKEHAFKILPPPPPPPEPKPQVAVVEPEPEPSVWPWIVGGLLIVLLLAGAIFGFIWWRKRKAYREALRQAQEQEQDDQNAKVLSENAPNMENMQPLKIPGSE
ncbi:hypothetical protein DBZ36_13005 [Alginatibacterium sediminis]|uniref:TIGR03503 family protein n=1 Tax=Alginatibacterium sediminis TaxID=2164068 RepID=A0A420E9I8_9ALTE|nr:hypothetical protein [Alginatibacterium sediminis]RKF17374.1 hypothetical protein DBZ36_13005 [Alginatibacterium sediminis]